MRSERHADPAIRRLQDRAAIRDVVVRYADGVDRRDFDQVGRCFAPDVHGEFGGEDRVGRDALIDFIRGVSHFHTTMHFMSGSLIEIHGDEASSDTVAALTHHAAGKSGRTFELHMSDARYREKLAFRDGEWVIVERGAQPRGSLSGVAPVESDDAAVRGLLDRAEIEDLLCRYAVFLDQRDEDGIERCLVPSFRGSHGEGRSVPKATWISQLRALERYGSTTHLLGNPIVDIHGDTALAAGRLLITTREQPIADVPPDWRRPKPREQHAVAWHANRLVRDGGRWRIAERRLGGRPDPLPVPAPPRSAKGEVERLLDTAQIRDCVATLACAIERKDTFAVESRLHPDFAGGGRDAAARWIATVEQRGEVAHILGNQRVRFDRETASVQTYAYVVSREAVPGEPARLSHWGHGAVRYVDRLVRDASGWRLTSRRAESLRVDA